MPLGTAALFHTFAFVRMSLNGVLLPLAFSAWLLSLSVTWDSLMLLHAQVLRCLLLKQYCILRMQESWSVHSVEEHKSCDDYN